MGPLIQIDINKAIKLYRDQGLPSTKVSRVVGCSVQTLINRLREYGVEIRSCGNHMEKCSLEQIRHEYEILKMSTTAIAKKHNMNPVSIWDRLKRGGVQLRDQKQETIKACTKIPLSEHIKICQRYMNNPTYSSKDIAKDYGVHSTTIQNILRKNGIKLSNTGARNHRYRGGITPLHTKLRNCEKADFWKRACLERDGYKCKITGKTENIQVHHFPVSFSMILGDFLKKNSSLDPIQDCDPLFELAQKYDLFWNIDNGIILCEETHKEMHMKNKITTEEIICLHEQGWSCEKISKHFGKSLGFARSRLMSIGYSLKNNGFYNEQRHVVSPEVEKLVLESYISGETTRGICVKFSICSSRLYKILEKNDIKPGKRKLVDQRSKPAQDPERVIRLKDAGATFSELAKMYDVSETTIRNILKHSHSQTNDNTFLP